jgi:hypothetical protein
MVEQAREYTQAEAHKMADKLRKIDAIVCEVNKAVTRDKSWTFKAVRCAAALLGISGVVQGDPLEVENLIDKCGGDRR